MLSKEVSSTILKVFGMTRPEIESRPPGWIDIHIAGILSSASRRQIVKGEFLRVNCSCVVLARRQTKSSACVKTRDRKFWGRRNKRIGQLGVSQVRDSGRETSRIERIATLAEKGYGESESGRRVVKTMTSDESAFSVTVGIFTRLL